MQRKFPTAASKILLLVISVLQVITIKDFCCLECLFLEQLRLAKKVKTEV